jgi:hypothetical protein
MPIFSAKQRAKLTPAERQRVGQFVVKIVHDGIESFTKLEKKELESLKIKMGPK